MKKYFIVLLIGICFCVEIFAENNFSKIYFDTAILIEEGLQENLLAIQKNSKELNSMQKMELIREFKEDFTVPLILNLFVPFGVGSFYQGDTAGGVICLVGDLTAVGLYVAGFVNYYTKLSQYDSDSESVDMDDVMVNSMILFISSGLVGLATGIFRIVRPITYAEKYNNDLFMALGRRGNRYSMKVIPGIDLTSSGNIAPSVSMVFSY